MAKKWNEYTRREKWIGGLAAVFAVFVIGNFANAVNNSTPTTDTTGTNTQPVTSYQEIRETEVIPFEKTTKEDSALAEGTTRVTVAGVDGEKTIVYRVTLVDGVETDRELLSESITTPPVSEETTIGTYVEPVVQPAASNCDSNYSGACVPIASDVDCAGGSGNGPAYVSGPVYVVGSDIYRLDGDGDGVGCE